MSFNNKDFNQIKKEYNQLLSFSMLVLKKTYINMEIAKRLGLKREEVTRMSNENISLTIDSIIKRIVAINEQFKEDIEIDLDSFSVDMLSEGVSVRKSSKENVLTFFENKQ